MPLDEAKDVAALKALRPGGKALVLRVNRLFWSDGEAGIERFRAIVARHDAAGFDSELQVRYHPAAADEGNIPKWLDYVRHVVDVFGADRHVVAMTITNEANLNISPNTSDGSYTGAVEALVQGVQAARAEADRIGRADLPFGFTYAYRFDPNRDANFWTQIGQLGGDGFRRALGFVGADLYPGTFYPPAIAPTSSPGQEVVKGLATVRRCYMPKAGLGDSVPIWITENGYPTTPGAHTEGEQAAALEGMVRAAVAVSATYGVTDYRWFNLRDNSSSSPGTFDTDGLLRDDYSEKPSFAKYRVLVAALGAAQPAAPPVTATPPRTCRSRRRVVVHLPRDAHAVALFVGGRKVRAPRRGRALTVNLSGRRAGVVRVTIRYVSRHGRHVTMHRRFRTCATKPAT